MSARRVVTALLLLAAVSGDAVAHSGGSIGYAVLTIDGARVRYALTLWPASLTPPLASQIEQARSGDEAARERLLDVVRERVVLESRGRRCAAAAAAVPPSGQDPKNVALVVEFTCAGEIRELRVRDDLPDAFGEDYHTLARIDTPSRSVQFAFAAESRETRVAVDAGGRGLGSFVRLGIEHILSGWDHLLFLLGLLLRGGSWLALAKIVTAFTLAHSVTLALAALDVVILPDRLVEAVIALSIAFVAAENLFLRPVVSRRWVVSFCFGLVHGFGFSSVLREMGLPAHGLLLSLFGFNAGVELGQALVVAVALPALALVRRTRWERRVVWSSSAAILLVGLVLFVERALF